MRGKRLSVDGLSLFYTTNASGNFKVGVSVSKRLANAVKRNRLKRQIRACVTRVLKDRTAGFDLVFVARRELATARFDQILKAVESALLRSALRSSRSEDAQS